MTPRPVAVAREATLREALRAMRDADVRHLPVLHRGKVVGVLSDRDVRLLLGVDPRTDDDPHLEAAFDSPVRRFMSTGVVTIGRDRPLSEAASLLARARVGALPVVDAEGRLVGVLSTTDVLLALAERLEDRRERGRHDTLDAREAGELLGHALPES
jgi:acetoin utilization protein AcuB